MLQVPLGKSKIRFMLGLWGTSDLKRVMVSLEQHKPNTILGYVREVDGFRWIAEGDPQNRSFETPREAAQHDYALLWETQQRLAGNFGIDSGKSSYVNWRITPCW